MSSTVTVSGRGWAYTFAALGGLVSIAANIAHSYVPPQGTPANWAPQPGAVIGAIVWPVFLFGAVELLARVAWPDGLRWQLLRFGGMLPVAAVAALVSYRHLSGLLAFYGEEAIVCVLGPLAVDGLMVMATGAILATGITKHSTTTNISVSAPVDTGTAPTPAPPAGPTPTLTPSTVDIAPPSTGDGGTTPVPAAPQPEPAPVPSPAVVAARITGADATSPTGSAVALRPAARTTRTRPGTPDVPTTDELAAPAPDTRVTGPDAAQLALPIVAPDLLARAREVATQYRTEHGTPITAGQMAIRLKVNSEQASQALAVLGLGPDSPTTHIPTVNGNPVKATR
jgi:hypothetical protein